MRYLCWSYLVLPVKPNGHNVYYITYYSHQPLYKFEIIYFILIMHELLYLCFPQATTYVVRCTCTVHFTVLRITQPHRINHQPELFITQHYPTTSLLLLLWTVLCVMSRLLGTLNKILYFLYIWWIFNYWVNLRVVWVSLCQHCSWNSVNWRIEWVNRCRVKIQDSTQHCQHLPSCKLKMWWNAQDINSL